MGRILFLLIASSFAAFVARADVEVRELAPGAVSPPAKIEQLAWLEGVWVGNGLGGETEESYSAPLGRSIMGNFRFVKDGKPVFYEFVTLVEEAGSLVMRIKHFRPDFVGWEEKDKFVAFKLVALEGQTAYFDGLTVKRDGDTLFSAVIIEDKKTGARRTEQFSYKLKK